MDTEMLDLMALTPDAALMMFLQSAAKPDLDTTRLALFEVAAGSGVQTSIRVGLDLVPADLSTWKYGGATPFAYNRMDLGDVFTGSGISLRFKPPSWPTSTAWICNQIATIGLIDFDPVDFEQDPQITEGMGILYLLRANPESRRWVGQVPIYLFNQTILPKLFVNSSGVLVTTFSSLEAITQDMGIGMRSIDTNATILGSQIKQYVVGTIFRNPANGPAVPWDLFNRVLKTNSWILDGSGPKPNNGYGASVIYNGPIVVGYDTPFNQNLDHVCRIQLNSSYCNNTDGVLSIYYSLIRVGN